MIISLIQSLPLDALDWFVLLFVLFIMFMNWNDKQNDKREYERAIYMEEARKNDTYPYSKRPKR